MCFGLNYFYEDKEAPLHIIQPTRAFITNYKNLTNSSHFQVFLYCLEMKDFIFDRDICPKALLNIGWVLSSLNF